jgi:anti-sigma B factor antagonist
VSESLTLSAPAEGQVRIAVAGELDLAGGTDLGDAVDRAFRDAAHRVVVDLHEVSFIDSSGLQRLAWLGSSRQGGQELVFVRPSEATRRLIDMTGLGDRLRFVEDA